MLSRSISKIRNTNTASLQFQKRTIISSSQKDGKQFFDYTQEPNLFELADKDTQGQFSLKVITKEAVSHDTYKFGLEFPNPEWTSGLWPGGHFLFVSEINGEMMQKPYTPITPVNHKGVAEFIIKIYRENS